MVLPAGAVVCSPAELQDSLRYPEFRSETVACSTAAAAADDAGGFPSSPSCPAEENSAAAGRTGSGVSYSIDKAFEFDHVYPAVGTDGGGGGDGPRTITVVLYGTVGSPAMMGFHRILKEAVETGCIPETEAAAPLEGDGENCAVRYVFRHALPYGPTFTDAASDGGGSGGDSRTTGSDSRSRFVGDVSNNNNGESFLAQAASASTAAGSTTTALQGYGVVLDVKNMEYKNYDPSATPTEAHDGAGAGREGKDGETSAPDDGLVIVNGEEVGGVVLSTLVSRRPELRRELGMLRQALLLEEAGSGDGESEELKLRTQCLKTKTERKKSF